jgi:uncharacterized protein
MLIKKLLFFILTITALNLTSIQAEAQSFDCSKANTSYENAVCSDEFLSSLDELMSMAYRQARQESIRYLEFPDMNHQMLLDSNSIIDTQRNFLKGLEMCGGKDCIIKLQIESIEAMSNNFRIIQLSSKHPNLDLKWSDPVQGICQENTRLARDVPQTWQTIQWASGKEGVCISLTLDMRDFYGVVSQDHMAFRLSSVGTGTSFCVMAGIAVRQSNQWVTKEEQCTLLLSNQDGIAISNDCHQHACGIFARLGQRF